MGDFNKKHRVLLLYGVGIFLLMYIFYVNVEPIMINDPDDWTYIGHIRTPLPIWKHWNPAKVFPETFEGIFGAIAAFVIYPICGDYVMSFTYVFAFIVAMTIALYIVGLTFFCREVFNIKQISAIIATFITFCMHFLLFRQEYRIPSKFLFSASNLNCFMNYTVPMLLNTLLAIWIISCFVQENKKEDIFYVLNTGDNKVRYKVGGYLIVLYFAVFSNMASNIVFIAPCTYIVLCRMKNAFATDGVSGVLKIDFLKRNSLFIYIFTMELICLRC